MKNKFAILLAVSLLIAVVLGCSSINPFSSKSKDSSPSSSNKTLTDKGDDSLAGDETTGVPECDEIFVFMAHEANDPNDNFVTKAIKATFFNAIKKQVKQAIEENKDKKDTATIADKCKDFKKQLEKFKAEEEQKKGK